MGRHQLIALYRVAFALLTLVAMGYMIYHLNDLDQLNLANFLSFFTIQSNVFTAAVFLYCATRPLGQRPSPTLDLVRGALTLYMATTGVVYGLLLTGYQQELQTHVWWVDTVLHRIMPLVVVADWLIDPPRSRLELRKALSWLAYPLVYVTYTLIRGPIVDWYPYPFLDPDHPDQVGGYGGVLAACVGIALGILLFTWLIVTIGNRVRLVSAPGGPEPRL